MKKYKFPFFVNAYYFLRIGFKWLITGRKDLKYYAMARLGNMFNPNFHFTEYGQVWRDEAAFEKYYDDLVGDEYHSIDRKYTVKQFLQLINNVEGDTVECGAYKGATSYLICTAIQLYAQSKKHHIFDSFEGLNKPDKEDGDYWKEGNLAVGEEMCRGNLSQFNFVKYYKGWIPERFSEVQALTFSFVHIDVDLYQPTLDSIAFFYERLNKGAIMICDDYGFVTCPGAKKAMDDFFIDKVEPVIMLTTGQAFIIKQ
jgi:hypothetical protein